MTSIQVSIIHALAHSLHVLRSSENEMVLVTDQSDENGYVHELYEIDLSPELERQNVLFASVAGAMMAIQHLKMPGETNRAQIALAMILGAPAELICASDEDIEVCKSVMDDKPDWLSAIIAEAQMFVEIMRLCVGFDAWCEEFATIIKDRPIKLDSAFFDQIVTTGVLPPLSNKLVAA